MSAAPTAAATPSKTKAGSVGPTVRRFLPRSIWTPWGQDRKEPFRTYNIRQTGAPMPTAAFPSRMCSPASLFRFAYSRRRRRRRGRLPPPMMMKVGADLDRPTTRPSCRAPSWRRRRRRGRRGLPLVHGKPGEGDGWPMDRPCPVQHSPEEERSRPTTTTTMGWEQKNRQGREDAPSALSFVCCRRGRCRRVRGSDAHYLSSLFGFCVSPLSKLLLT
jgi:hypothetical protein